MQGWGDQNKETLREAGGPGLILDSFFQARSDSKIGWVCWGYLTLQKLTAESRKGTSGPLNPLHSFYRRGNWGSGNRSPTGS